MARITSPSEEIEHSRRQDKDKFPHLRRPPLGGSNIPMTFPLATFESWSLITDSTLPHTKLALVIPAIKDNGSDQH